MKIKRHKNVKKCLNFYKNNFNFRAPYQIIVDSTFCHEALQCKLNIKDQIPKYLEDPNVRLYTTPCVVMETEGLGSKAFGAMLVVKQFKVRKCGHEKNSTISAEECILSMVGDSNPDHLIVATTDAQLSSKCRLIPGVPLMYVRYNAITLEKPSPASVEAATNKMKAAVETPCEQKAFLQKLKSTEEVTPFRKKRKARGPNPLSCKKKKVKPNPTTNQTEKAAKKKRRKRARKAASLLQLTNSQNENKNDL